MLRKKKNVILKTLPLLSKFTRMKKKNIKKWTMKKEEFFVIVNVKNFILFKWAKS